MKKQLGLIYDNRIPGDRVHAKFHFDHIPYTDTVNIIIEEQTSFESNGEAVGVGVYLDDTLCFIIPLRVFGISRVREGDFLHLRPEQPIFRSVRGKNREVV
jgi:hypothetical protein